MNVANKKSTADLQLAFDVGHSSIGWAVLEAHGGQAPTLLGCGSVIFPADDCLASERRTFRRQRRHVRATRLRIARLKRLLAHLGVLDEKQLDTPGCAWPWLLAARVLRGGNALTWSELWDVLRWYAHNRGYDGNKAWSRQVGDELDDTQLDELAKSQSLTEDEKSDIEKVKTARKLMRGKGTATMAETFCAVCGLDPLGEKKSCNLSGNERFKAQKAAFPREIIEDEVRRLLRAHQGALPKLDDAFIRALMQDWCAIPCPEIVLPKRFKGGLLFGQLIPRFENRIIATCPLSGEKVPARRCREFLDFRWTMLMAGIRIASVADEELRPLTPDERLALDRRGRELGFFRYDPDKPDKKTGDIKRGRNELREHLRDLFAHDRDNLDGVLFDDNMREALKILPVTDHTEAFRIAWGAFDGPTRDEKTGAYLPDKLRGRFVTMLLRGTRERPASLSIAEILAHLGKWKASTITDRILERLHTGAVKKGKPDARKLAELEVARFGLERLSGRARYGREVMAQAVQDWMRREQPLNPTEKGGSMERTVAILEAERQCELDALTNNHLVRHRLRLLAGDLAATPKPFRGLLDDLVATYAGGEFGRIKRITVEVARDLQEMSGKTSKEKAAVHNQKLSTHDDAAEALAEAMRAEGIPFLEADGRPRFNATLIRKARIALDMEVRDESKKRQRLAFRCPYTDRIHCLVDVARGRLELDHIIPLSKRLSDAMEALVLTSPEINREKKNRTALEFIREMNNKPENRARRDELEIVTEKRFLEIVGGLWPKSDPFRRARAGGERVTDDQARCWRRRELLQVPKWEVREFTPADLAKTRHLNKLAIQRLEARFPEDARPPIITIKGAVTKAFRDRAWRLLPLLADHADKANLTPVNAVFARWRTELAAGREFNLKKHLRGATHLQHALDAATIGLVTELLVPCGHGSLNGRLETLLIKRKLSPEERDEFREFATRLGLRPFLRWGKENEIWLDDLPNVLKEQIHARLAERRVVQHISKETAGLPAELNAWRVLDVQDGIATLRQRIRQADGSRPRKPDVKVNTNKLIGLKPGELKHRQAALIIKDNYGLALDPTPTIIPFHKVWVRLRELREANGGSTIRVVRNGMLIRATVLKHEGIGRPKKDAKPKEYPGIYRVVSIKNQASGEVEFDLCHPDGIELAFSNRAYPREIVGLEILKTPLCGVAPTLPED